MEVLCLKYVKQQTNTSERLRSAEMSKPGGRAAGLEFRRKRASMFLFISGPVWRTGGVLGLLIYDGEQEDELSN